MKRVIRRESNGDFHRLLVDNVRSRDFVGCWEDFDGKVLVLELSHRVGLSQSRELVVDNDGREVTGSEGGDGHRELTILAFEPPDSDERL